ncbi:MAG TPA: recombination regulator RecX [Burkholderiaceae bacterium]|nr:recombination regulator RecX [Burkholderiaceae bacterium]
MPAARQARKNDRTPLRRAVALLARREYSRAELAWRLARDLPPESDGAEIERVLDDLQARGMLSDVRFAQALARTRGQRFGTARIRQELKERGVADELVRSSVAALASTELQRAQEVWRKRFGRPPATPEERVRQMRFLSQRGFEASVIVRVVGRATDDDR